MEALIPYARASLALAAFLLLFLGIANLSAGRYAFAGATLASGLAATIYIARTRQPASRPHER